MKDIEIPPIILVIVFNGYLVSVLFYDVLVAYGNIDGEEWFINIAIFISVFFFFVMILYLFFTNKWNWKYTRIFLPLVIIGLCIQVLISMTLLFYTGSMITFVFVLFPFLFFIIFCVYNLNTPSLDISEIQFTHLRIISLLIVFLQPVIILLILGIFLEIVFDPIYVYTILPLYILTTIMYPYFVFKDTLFCVKKYELNSSFVYGTTVLSFIVLFSIGLFGVAFTIIYFFHRLIIMLNYYVRIYFKE